MSRHAPMWWFLLVAAACGGEPRETAVEGAVLTRGQQALALHRSSLARDLSRNPTNLKRVQLAKGIRAVRIESGFRHVTMVKLDRDGGIHHDCVDELQIEGAK
jgi:hypothetical protein